MSTSLQQGPPNPFLESYLALSSDTTSRSRHQGYGCSSFSLCTGALDSAASDISNGPSRHEEGSAVSCPAQQQLALREFSVARQTGERFADQPHIMPRAHSSSTSMETADVPCKTSTLARTSTGPFLSPFAASSVHLFTPSPDQQLSRAPSSTLTQVLRQNSYQEDIAAQPHAAAAADMGLPAVSAKPRWLPVITTEANFNQAIASVPIPKQQDAGKAWPAECLHGSSPSSTTGSVSASTIYGASPTDIVHNSFSSAFELWSPALGSAPTGLQWGGAFTSAAGSTTDLMRVQGSSTNSIGSMLSLRPPQVLADGHSLAGQHMHMDMSRQDSLPCSRCTSHCSRSSGAVPGMLEGCERSCSELPRTMQTPRGAICRNLSTLDLRCSSCSLGAVGGMHKLMHGCNSVPGPRPADAGVMRDALNKIAGELRAAASLPAAVVSISVVQGHSSSAAKRCTPEERAQKLARYRAKRDKRTFARTVKYQCRKALAESRLRVKGRFARDGEPGSVLPQETKKAHIQHQQPSIKTQGKSVGNAAQLLSDPNPPVAARLMQAVGAPSTGVTFQEAYMLAAATQGGANSASSGQPNPAHTAQQAGAREPCAHTCTPAASQNVGGASAGDPSSIQR